MVLQSATYHWSESALAGDLPVALPDWARRAIAEALFRSERDDHVFMEAFFGSAEVNVQALKRVLVGALDLDDVPRVKRLRLASLQAEARVSQAAFQRAYRISFFLQWHERSHVVAAEARARCRPRRSRRGHGRASSVWRKGRRARRDARIRPLRPQQLRYIGEFGP